MKRKLVFASAIIMTSFFTIDAEAQLLDKVISTVLDEVTGSGSSSDSSSSKKSRKSQSSTQSTQNNTQTGQSSASTEQSGTAAQPQKAATSSDPDDIFNAKQTVANSGKTFTKSEFGYSIKYPDTWKYALSTENTVSFTNPAGEAEISIQNILGPASASKYKSTDEVIKDLKAQISASTVAPRFIPERDYTLVGTAYKGREFAAEYTMNGIKYRQWFVVIPRMDGKIFYSIYLLVPAESWTKHLPTGKEVIAGLKIENDTAAGSTAESTVAAPARPGVLTAPVAAAQVQTPETAATAVQQVQAVQTNVNAVQTATKNLSTQYQGISQDINWVNSSIAGESRTYQMNRDRIKMNLKYNSENAYKNVKCPQCGKIGSFVFVNEKYGWACPGCSYFAGSLLSLKDESGKTYGDQLDLAYKDSCDKVTQLRKKGNDICSSNSLAPYWDLNAAMPFSKENLSSLPQGTLPVTSSVTVSGTSAASSQTGTTTPEASTTKQSSPSGTGLKPPDDFTF